MEELGGKSFFKSVPDWHERPILGAILEHGKEVHATGESVVGIWFHMAGANIPMWYKSTVHILSQEHMHPTGNL
jgi:hypothetical protein